MCQPARRRGWRWCGSSRPGAGENWWRFTGSATSTLRISSGLIHTEFACGYFGKERNLMERAVQVFATIHFSIIGLSHLVYPDIWVDFFIWLRERGRPGAFVHGFISLGFGSIVVAFHPVWS